METFTAACIQNNATNSIEKNLPVVRDFIRQAAEMGANFISLPECVSLFEPDSEALIEKAPEEINHPFLPMYAEEAQSSGAWILGGTLAIKEDTNSRENNKILNRLYLINPAGKIVAKYDKIHMFDVKLGENLIYEESATYSRGKQAVVTSIPWGNLGLSICYDIRFPYLYRALAKAGANILCAPSAFTKITGSAHWHVLQRARAIETGSFVISAATCGTHSQDRQTFGHSLIVDPWGEILADGGPDPGVIVATIDMHKVKTAREKVPSLTHDKDFTF